MPSGPVFGTSPRRASRFGSRTGYLRGAIHHPLMIPDHDRTVESAGEKLRRREKPTIALRASVDPTEARRDRRESAIHRLDVQKFLELTGIPEGAMRRPN